MWGYFFIAAVFFVGLCVLTFGTIYVLLVAMPVIVISGIYVAVSPGFTLESLTAENPWVVGLVVVGTLAPFLRMITLRAANVKDSSCASGNTEVGDLTVARGFFVWLFFCLIFAGLLNYFEPVAWWFWLIFSFLSFGMFPILSEVRAAARISHDHTFPLGDAGSITVEEGRYATSYQFPTPASTQSDENLLSIHGHAARTMALRNGIVLKENIYPFEIIRKHPSRDAVLIDLPTVNKNRRFWAILGEDHLKQPHAKTFLYGEKEDDLEDWFRVNEQRDRFLKDDLTKSAEDLAALHWPLVDRLDKWREKQRWHRRNEGSGHHPKDQ